MNSGAKYGIIGAIIAIAIGIVAIASMGTGDIVDDSDMDVVDTPMMDDMETVVVGVILPATGDLSSHGQDNKLGVELGVVDFNEMLMETNAGWKMEIIIEDTQTDPLIALEKIQSLNAKGIKFILGPETSAETRNVKSYVDSNNMIIISPSSTAPALAIVDNIFRFVPDDTIQGKVIAAIMEDNGIEVMVPIYRGDVWGDGLYESSARSFEDIGGIVSEGIRYSPDVQDFATEMSILSKQVDKEMESRDADKIAVMTIGFDETVQLFNAATSYDNLGSILWVGSDGAANNGRIAEDPIASGFAQDTNFIAGQFAASDNEIFEHVKDNLTAQIGVAPNTYVYSSYDSVWVLGLTIDEFGTDVDTVKANLAAIGADYTGAIGNVILNEAGDLATSDYVLSEITDDGEWEITSRYSAATGEISSLVEEEMEIVRVGVLLPATGDLSSHGQDNKLGVELGVVDFNEMLMETNAGWKMEIIVEDTQTDPLIALEKAQSLNAKGIKFILGPETSAETRNVKSYVDSNNMIIISPSSTAPALAIVDNIFRFVPDDTIQGKVIAAIMEDNGIEVMVPIYRGDVWGDGLYESSARSFEDIGGIVSEGIRYSPDVQDFATEMSILSKQVDKEMESRDADKIAVMTIGFDETVQLFNAAASYDNLGSILWVGSDGAANNGRIAEDPIASGFAQDANFIAGQFAASDNETFEHVRDSLTAQIGVAPNTYVYSSYDSVWVLGLTIDEFGTDVDTVKANLAAIGADYTGAIGNVILNEAGDLATSDYVLAQINDDSEWEITSRYSADTGEIISLVDEEMSSSTVDVAPKEMEIVRVGVLLPATGDLSSHGQDNKLGVELGVVDFNEMLMETNAGWKMEIIVEDTQTDPLIALEKAQSLNAKGIKFILGPETSAETRNVKSYVDSNNMIIISPSSTAPALAIVDNIFRFVPDDTIQGKVIAAILEDNGIEVMVPIYRGDVWGDGLYESSARSFEDIGGIVSEGIRYSPDVQDFATEMSILSKQVDKEMESRDADKIAVMTIGFDETVQLFNAAASYDNLGSILWVGSDGAANNGRIAEDPIASGFAQDANFIAGQFAASDNETFEHVRDSLAAQIGVAPNTYVYSSYDSVWVLGLTIDEFGTDVDTVKANLAAIGADYTGAIGNVILNEAGDLATSDYVLAQINDDSEWEITSRYSADTGEIISLVDEEMSSSTVDVAPKEIEIVGVGVLLPATGDLASHGQDNKLGVELGVVDFNEMLMETNAGWQIKLIAEDTQTDPILALEKAQSLNSKGVKFILGPETSAEIRNIKSYVDSNNMMVVSPSSTAPALAIADNIFRLVPDDSKQGKVVAALLQDRGIKVVIPIHRGDVWGDGLHESSSRSFMELGGIVSEGIRYSPDVQDFATETNILSKRVAEYMETYEQDEIGILLISFDEAVQLITAAASYDNLRAISWIGSDASADSGRIAEDPITSKFVQDTDFVAAQFSASDNEIFEHVRTSLTEQIGSSPNNYVYSSYDSVWVLGLTIEKFGTDVDAVKANFAAVGADHTGAIGNVILNEAGDLASADYILWELLGDEWDITSRYSADTGEITPLH